VVKNLKTLLLIHTVHPLKNVILRDNQWKNEIQLFDYSA